MIYILSTLFSKFLSRICFCSGGRGCVQKQPSIARHFSSFSPLPSAHAPPKPNPEESFSMESNIDSSDIEFGRAEDGEAEDESGGHSPSPSYGTRVDYPKGMRIAVWKRRGASQSSADR